MTSEELQKRQRRAETEPMVIARIGEDFRVHSPGISRHTYVVSGIGQNPTCTCPDFEHHAEDPEWQCKHILAVLDKVSSPDAAPMPEERQGGGFNGNGATQMLLKRSVSPDGRIDSLSVEFSAPLNGEPITDIEQNANRILSIQKRIVDQFLSRNGRGTARPEPDGDESGQPIPAELVGVRGADGRWGRRLFLTVRTGEGYLRLYGSRKQLAEHLTAAGYSEYARNIHEGLQLDLPCQIITRPTDDGKFINIERVLPPLTSPAYSR